jgi:hypothetical protein
MSDTNINDLRRSFFGGSVDEERDAIADALAAGITFADLIAAAESAIAVITGTANTASIAGNAAINFTISSQTGGFSLNAGDLVVPSSGLYRVDFVAFSAGADDPVDITVLPSLNSFVLGTPTTVAAPYSFAGSSLANIEDEAVDFIQVKAGWTEDVGTAGEVTLTAVVSKIGSFATLA